MVGERNGTLYKDPSFAMLGAVLSALCSVAIAQDWIVASSSVR